MAWFAYITEYCKTAAKKHTVWEAVEDFQKSVEELQELSLTRFHQFPQPYLVKKKFAGREGRLIAERHYISLGQDEHTIILFLDFMTRGDSGYDKKTGFGHDPIAYGKTHYEQVPEELLRQYVTDRMKADPIPELDPPSEYECGYLHSALQQNGDWGNEFIYESQDWNDTINQSEYIHNWGSIFNQLSTLSNAPQGAIVTPFDKSLCVLSYYFPSLHIRFLAGLGTERALNELRLKYDHLLTNPSLEELSRNACRAYPTMVLGADRHVWEQIENEKSGNMALSPEESNLLDRIGNNSEGAYPLFINGRAGSGKSTILQYLFSDYLGYYLKHISSAPAQSMPPLYLTCSDNLLNKARENVKDFLVCSTKDMDGGFNKESIQQHDSVFRKAFKPFYAFLKEQIPADAQELFAPARHVSYARFVEMWQERFSTETEIFKIGPEICWHIIRTFVKGSNISDFLEPEDYLDGLRKEHSVSQEHYELVFRKVWENWYYEKTVDRHNEDKPGEYWDDQDLVRYVIRNKYCKRNYPVIFCDEAQDFTRIELNAILNLSLFSQRKIFSYQVPLLPFAFAGDPFQTLNPTGFRWEAIKDRFVEQFINTHHGDGKGILNYFELHNNYRSDAGIVRFCNTVQGLRGGFLDIDIKPQLPWRQENIPGRVAYFDEKNSRFWDWIKTRDDVVFVVPCDKGGEKEYWQKSSLSQHMDFDGVTVMSAIAIKGLEYDCIVVYGFGQSAPEQLCSYLSSGTQAREKLRLPVEYFINKLYVAVSRAQHCLLVLDSENAEQAFWRPFMNEMIEQRLPADTDFAQNCLLLAKGDGETLAGGHGDDINAAEKFYHDGMDTGNAYLLRRAAKAYQKLRRFPDEAKCSAYALFFEKKFMDAANASQDADFSFKHKSLWLAGTEEAFSQIFASREKPSDFVEKSPEYKLVEQFFAKKPAISDVCLEQLNEIYRLYTVERELLIDQEDASTAWQSVVGKVYKNIKGLLLDEAQKEMLWQLSQKFQLLNLAPPPEIMAHVAFDCGKYQEAAILLKDSKNPEDIQLRQQADRMCMTLDQQIQSQFSGEHWEEIRKLYQDHSMEHFSDPAMQQIATACAICGNAEIAVNLLRSNYSRDIVKGILKYKAVPLNIRNYLENQNIRGMVAACDYVAVRELIRDAKARGSKERLFLQVFAHCDAGTFCANADTSLLMSIVRWLKLFCQNTEKKYITEHFFELGCAFEKANNIKEAKEFYKGAKRYVTGPLLDLAEKRLLVCFERHAKVMDDERSRSMQLREAQKLREHLCLQNVKIGDPALPEYECGNNPWAIGLDEVPALPEKITLGTPSLPESEKLAAPSTSPRELPPHEDPPLVASPQAEQANMPQPPIPSKSDDTLLKLVDRAIDLQQRIIASLPRLATLNAEHLRQFKKKTDELVEIYELITMKTAVVRGEEAAWMHCDSLEELRRLSEAFDAEEQKREAVRLFEEFLDGVEEAIQRLELRPVEQEIVRQEEEKELAELKKEAVNLFGFADTGCDIPLIWHRELDANAWLRGVIREKNINAIIEMFPHCVKMSRYFRWLRDELVLR